MATINTSSGNASTISLSGVLSGMNTGQIVQQLVQADSGPLDDLQTQQTTDQTKLTNYQQLNTNVLSLQVAAEAFTTGNAFGATSATSSNTSDITATGSDNAIPGTYQVTVNQLAQSSEVLSQGYATGATLGTGTITVGIGSASYAPIKITSQNDTLTGIAAAINQANNGIQATVVDDGSVSTPEHLLLTSTSSGDGQDITMTSNLNGSNAPTLTTLQKAQDAEITLGGTGGTPLTIQSTSNTVTTAIPGVTLQLQQQDPGNPSTITVQADTSSIQNSIQNFITAYNSVNSFFGTALSYDATTQTAGPLMGDGTATEIQNSLNNALITGRGNSVANLESIGITFDSSGNLQISNQQQLTDALQNNLSGVEDLFTNAKTGVATQTNTYINDVTNPSSGILTLQQNFLQEDYTDLNTSITQQQTILSNEQTMLTQEYTNMESGLASLEAQNAAVATLGNLATALPTATSAMSNASSNSSSSGSGSSSG